MLENPEHRLNIREQLLVELSYFNIHYVADSVGTDPGFFKTIMELVLKDKDPVPARAAWVAELVTQKDPGLIRPYLKDIVKGLKRYTHPGTTRNILKILMRTEIPESLQGILVDYCFRCIADADEKVAAKVYAMQIIENHVPMYPELAGELSEMIRDQFSKNSAGFKSRGRKVLKNMEKYL
ncbi:MAG: hypothetical protein IH594_09080 [Bacteroidales bacterium]|nr:hypothetical protein [Bacteroidales bacterium]